MAIQSFRDLLVWQKAVHCAVLIYEVTKYLPADERFGLISQMRRCAVSVSSNLAEGHSRQGAEFPYFISVSRGSLAECESQLHVCIELGYLEREHAQECFASAEELRIMMATLESKVRLANS